MRERVGGVQALQEGNRVSQWIWRQETWILVLSLHLISTQPSSSLGSVFAIRGYDMSFLQGSAFSVRFQCLPSSVGHSLGWARWHLYPSLPCHPSPLGPLSLNCSVQTQTWPSPTPTPASPPRCEELLSVVCERPEASTLSCLHSPETWVSSATSRVEPVLSHPLDFRPGRDRSALCLHCSSKLLVFFPQSTLLPGDLASALHSCPCCLLPASQSPSFTCWTYQSWVPSFLFHPDSSHRLWWLEHPHRQFWWHHSREPLISGDAFLHTQTFIDNKHRDNGPIGGGSIYLQNYNFYNWGDCIYFPSWDNFVNERGYQSN